MQQSLAGVLTASAKATDSRKVSANVFPDFFAKKPAWQSPSAIISGACTD